MKAEVLQKRIEKKLFKNGKLLPKYSETIMFLSWGFMPRRVHLIHKSKLAGGLEGLDLLGIKYIRGNNAPRGGKVGDYVMLSPKAIAATNPWRKWFKNEVSRELRARDKGFGGLAVNRVLTDKKMLIG